MGRTPSSPAPPEVDDVNFHYRSPFKRNVNSNTHSKSAASNSSSSPPSSQFRNHRSTRSLKKPWFKNAKSLIYLSVFLALFVFVFASLVLQSSMSSVFVNAGGRDRSSRSLREGLKFGNSLKFVPSESLVQRFLKRKGIDSLRKDNRIGVRMPRLGLILGNMNKDPSSLMLFTVMKNIREIGYELKIYAVEDGVARPMWEQLGGLILVISPEKYGHLDWSMFEGIIAYSVEAKEAISSLMQEPFCSIPLLWIIVNDALAARLPLYKESGWDLLISQWKASFSRADIVLFPDFSLPMLYSVLDTGNFFVIPGSPVDVWAAESYSKSHSKYQLRIDKGFTKDDMLVLILGSSFFYNELSWDYAVLMHAIGPLLMKYARRDGTGPVYKFLFLCGNSSSGYSEALQEVASRLGLKPGSLMHYGMNDDVNSLLLMADIVLYGSSQDELGFPPLLTRAMSYGIPIVAPNLPVIKKYVVHGIHGMIFLKHDPDALMSTFSLLVSNGKVTKFAHTVASSGRLFARNMLASDCVTGYAKLLEKVVNFPSDVSLPNPVSQIQQSTWEWSMFNEEIEQRLVDQAHVHEDDNFVRKSSFMYALEKYMTNSKIYMNENVSKEEDIPTKLDWEVLNEMEISEDSERREMEELEERTEKDHGVWDDIYRNARKVEKLKFESNERDEGELERTGQPVCIYEVYSGSGAWPFLHHGSMYRGLSLTTRGRRLRSDDVDAVGRLSFLNDTYYRNILCEIGGMFAIANKVDRIHMRPWIGFQSWRATARKVSLSAKAESAIEETIRGNDKGDVIYFWARMDTDGEVAGSSNALTFWSMCDLLNGGHCRTAFENAFRRMYALPSYAEALPPMPHDDGAWSILHSWLMPTPSFLEFIMFSRMFVDSLDALHFNASKSAFCLLGSSDLEKKHCYCRVMEILVNVWAYHSARKMIYIDPQTGSLKEQHPVEKRKGFMWTEYFNFTLLKSMDEDLAEAADDGDLQSEVWLWPLTGEVHWKGIYEREREERYRAKMDKKRKTKEKLVERMKFGYKQKTLADRKP